jgi:hypothetical protein
MSRLNTLDTIIHHKEQLYYEKYIISKNNNNIIQSYILNNFKIHEKKCSKTTRRIMQDTHPPVSTNQLVHYYEIAYHCHAYTVIVVNIVVGLLIVCQFLVEDIVGLNQDHLLMRNRQQIYYF